jgi:ribonucleoside-diphosphate reductase alpha chain
MLARSLAAWDDALLFGTKFGFRNAQVTVIAPTGTIGLLMDCDTTGVEPDFALTKFKKLAGGGYFKIANQSLRPAMKALGYSATQTDEILAHVMGTLNLDTPMPDADGRIPATGPTFRQHLTAKGYTGDNLVALENQLPMMFELGFAFSAWSMPTQVLEAAGLDPAAAKADGKFNGLKVLGLKKKQIESLNRRICGTQTVEGAPHLKAEHLAVFDCANKCGPTGTRFIRPEGHILMMAAAQPFISGAISKTINMASEATVEQIGDAYRMSWELGLKANALYRDGSKLSQPLSTKTDVEQEDEDTEGLEESATAGEPMASAASSQGATRAAAVPATSTSTTSFESPVAEESSILVEGDRFVERIVERVVERVIERPMRRRLNETRGSITHKFNVAGHEGYLIVGLYEDGRPGELFITMAKEGSTIGGLMDSLGTAISVALQYGVPVESLVNKFAHQRFEPMGMTTNSDIPFAKSLVDYIFRWMGMQFIAGYRDQNAPRRPASVAAPVTAEPLADHHGRGVKEDTAWQHRTEGASARLGDRISSSDMGASGSSTDSPRGSERIASILSETTQITESDVSTSAHSAGVSVVTETTVATKRVSVLDQATATLMGDAPACDGCGSITVRNGTCYRCLNCGNSMGCS